MNLKINFYRVDLYKCRNILEKNYHIEGLHAPHEDCLCWRVHSSLVCSTVRNSSHVTSLCKLSIPIWSGYHDWILKWLFHFYIFLAYNSLCSPSAKKCLWLAHAYVLIPWKKVTVSKAIWTKFAMCSSFVRNLFLQSTNKSGDLYRRNLGKNDGTVRQNPVVTLWLL